MSAPNVLPPPAEHPTDQNGLGKTVVMDPSSCFVPLTDSHVAQLALNAMSPLTIALDGNRVAGTAYVTSSRRTSSCSSAAGKEAQVEIIKETLVDMSMETVLKVMRSEVIYDEDGAPLRELFFKISGSGLAPWEIHRPQQVVMELAKRGVFHGRTVLDAGCGIGDNALYLARYCACREVTAFDLVPRCLQFAEAKEGLRQGMKGKVKWLLADGVDLGASPLAGKWWDVVLDVSTFHCFGNMDRAAYCEGLKGLVRPGGHLLLVAMSDKGSSHVAGPRRVSQNEIYKSFPASSGWEVESIEDTLLEHHPNINRTGGRNGWPAWRGYAEAHLAVIRRL
eukprot:CAMPEP_0202895668 /NCGR_PEP_ID=MMETSP1392-20130828/4817_1 /ASSEMBLY_ACC=CAM_ASM_000868 /TAXON_ID=225041 /ORGANISM="Chlamydomonas chlamydogama, Strain SAG 11-48b" /LENGTH=335 /DNA_ID=CAMNT_0049580763 /DNA_START=395 /DNA_END=1402 /DNA_ORIENTATION=+